MPAYKDSKQGTWYASFYFENWKNVKQKKLKRGFATKKDALAWEREFLLQQAADLTMTFEAFVEIYITDKKKRLRENTWSTKEHIIRTKILPYFKEKKLSEIKPRDVIAWQNEMLNYRDKNGKAYSPTYLKTLHGQLSAILNHAVRFYGLKSNAAATAGCMGSEKHKEMLFWTKEEYLKFAEVMMDKPQSYYAFEVLYWCGIREVELLALTPADFDLDKGLLSITKSYQRLKGRDVITDPKTPKSVRVIQMPQFLTDEIRDYLKSLYKVQPDMQGFQERNPTLWVFGAFLHMDEATPHLHIDFVPYVSGWKGKGLDTKVSLKQALKALGFAGGSKRESELNQWINAEKEQLAAVMERHGIEWEQKGTHEEHLSVLDFKKQERGKEVAALEAAKQECQTDLTEMQEQLETAQTAVEAAEQRVQKAESTYQKQSQKLNKLAPIMEGLESLSAQYSQRPEEWVPEAATFETAKSYREKRPCR